MSDFAVITGGARNIGAAVAKHLTEDGFRVIVVDREEPSHSSYDELVLVDLSDVRETREQLSRVVETRRVTRLVNNAGIVLPASLEDTDPESIDQVVAVNLKAPIVCAQTVLPSMKRAGIGRIVNVSSRVALGKELRTVYSATKAGLHGMTKTWALELAASQITVNAVGPGPIRTSLFDEVNPPGDARTQAIISKVPVGRLGTSEDLAAAISYFASDEAGFVTGQVLYVCGGMTIGSA